MEYPIKFLIIVFISSFLGIFIAVFNNDIIQDKQNLENENTISKDVQKIDKNKTINDKNKPKDKDSDQNQNKNDIQYSTL